MKSQPAFIRGFQAWFALTPQELLYTGGIVLILLIGSVARYLHLKHEKAETYVPAGLVEAERALK